MGKQNIYEHISQEEFAFVNEGERIHDKKLEDKPVGYFRDAWNRFRKSHAAVIAAVIIILIVLFAVFAPVLIRSHDSTFMVSTYAKKPPRVKILQQLGLDTGSASRNFSDKSLIKMISLGVAAEGWDGSVMSLGESMDSKYQPILEITDERVTIGADKKESLSFTAELENYYEVGFLYKTIEQSEYAKIREWEEETGLHVLYPLVNDNEYNLDSTDANYWYKSVKGTPVKTDANGNVKKLSYSEDLVLEDNYKRDSDGNLVYYEYASGGTIETAQYKVRVLYYNYYQYLYGSEPYYLLGTDSQGYDLALRIAGGIRLSLMISIFVFVLNFVIGAIYGAIEGYYGGAADIIMERVSDILSGMPFVVVATLFQIHLSAKVGVVPCLLFAFVVTGWIGTASSVRTQFYRFKNQEYVMAARTLGARDRRIIWKHIFPNSLGTIITSCALDIPATIMSESTMSYLGIVKLSTAKVTSLGTLLSDASSIWTNYPHLMIWPALVISLLMICFNLFGNGLRDAFNPALRGVEE
jgi:oligopeptide transport system permease protein